MSRVVRLSPHARGDIRRLVGFLSERDLRSAQRLLNTFAEALGSLETLSERGPLAGPADDLRELRVGFGRYGYILQYRVRPDEVFVARIFHVREAR